MKKLLLSSAVLFFSLLALAQAPQTIPYQAVARDASGNLLQSSTVCVQFRIYNQASGGALLYEEHHKVSTNSLGLFTVSVGDLSLPGSGYDGGSYSTLGAVPWGSTAVYMEVALDLTGNCSGYTTMGRSQMMSVPFALYAASGGTAQVNSDWNAASGVAQILNKPTIPVFPPAGGTSTEYITGAGTLVTFPTLNAGTVTSVTAASGGGLATTPAAGITSSGSIGIATNGVTYADIQKETNATLLGNSSGASASPSEITVGSGLSLSGGVLNTTVIPTCGPVPGTPGGLSSSYTVCVNSNLTASITAPSGGAFTYVWTVPTGWTINSGQYTNSISLTAPATPGSGTLSVVATNNCGQAGTPATATVTASNTGSASNASVTVPNNATFFGAQQVVVFTGSATGTGINYQWSITPSSAASNVSSSGNSYSVTFNGTVGTSATATISVTASGCASGSSSYTTSNLQYGGNTTISAATAGTAWPASGTLGITTNVYVQLWGAGGGGFGGSGGAGAYVSGTITVPAAASLNLIVGGGGSDNGGGTAAIGGGGVGGTGSGDNGCGGGGMTAIKSGSTYLVVAGGGGGSGSYYNSPYYPGGGGGGGTNGFDNYSSAGNAGGVAGSGSAAGGVGGSVTGTAGSSGTGGAGASAKYAGGGGGGGYPNGGGGGGGATSTSTASGGGGGGASYTSYSGGGGFTVSVTNANGGSTGSSYSSNTAPAYTTVAVSSPGTGGYVTGVGIGGKGSSSTNGGPGEIILSW